MNIGNLIVFSCSIISFFIILFIIIKSRRIVSLCMFIYCKIFASKLPDEDLTSKKSEAIIASHQADYYEQIIQVREFYKRLSVVYSVMAENRVYALFIDNYIKIRIAYERYAIDEEEQPYLVAFLLLFSSLFGATQFDNIQGDISDAAGDIAKMIMNYYDDQVSNIFFGISFDNPSKIYHMNDEHRSSQIIEISSTVTSYFSTAIAGIKEIEELRNWFRLNHQSYVSAAKGEFDWVSLARELGARVLAALNPAIGIPYLLETFKFQEDRHDAEMILIDRYVTLSGEFQEKVFSLIEQLTKASEQTKDYVAEKIMEFNENTIFAFLNERSACGCNLDHYLKFIDFEDLEHLERKILGELSHK